MITILMNPTKTRGKSAINKLPDKTLPSTATSAASTLLTIEQIPRTNFSKKVFHRSQTSLNPTNLNKLNYPKKFIPPTNYVEQICEETPPSSHSQSPTNTKIKRTDEEREKLPDRINLDKKGLTTIPIIEDEPNLRLLSLQHNLINTFHIPELLHQLDNVQRAAHTEKEKKGLPLAEEIQRQRSTTTGGRNQLVLHNSSISYSANARPPNHTPNSSKVNNNSNLMFLPKNQTPQPVQQKGKYLLKKSSSFINLNQQIISTSSSSIIRINNNSNNNNLDKTKRHHKLLAMQTPSLSIENLLTTSTIDYEPLQQHHHYNSSTDVGNKLRRSDEQIIKYNLSNLVFLDLYDNQIEKISNLDGLKSLTVLLLGKNRITDISGLVALKTTLRVLDLHGNKITNISQKISQLQELKSLNLAGNALRQIQATDFVGLFSLKELNLKRNRLKKLSGFDDLRSLERLWLCHNDLQKVADMGAVAKAVNLKEVTIQNNPVSLAGDCVSFLVSYLPNLTLLSQMQITEQVRRAAMAWRKNKELSDKNYLTLSTNVCQNIRREEIISNARTNWELLRSQQPAVVQKTVTNKIDVEIRSNVSEPKIVQSALKSKQRYKPRTIHRAISQDLVALTSSTSTTADNLESDYFRLPPILAPYFNANAPVVGPQENSVCSMGPNIDSSSSVCSSENENVELPISYFNGAEEDEELLIPIENVEAKNLPVEPEISEKSEAADTENIERVSKPDDRRPSLAIISLNEIDLDENLGDDKISNLSTVSAKTTTESNHTTSSDDQQSSQRTANKCRSALPARKCYSGMMRAQTAKNFVLTQQVGQTSTTTNPPKQSQNKMMEREREQGSDYLIEICGRYLNIYGLGSLKFIEKQWNVQKANDVHTIKFSYINFNSISTILCRMKQRFPNADHFVFRETNITCLGQLNALAETQGITSLTIDPEGNVIAEKSWHHYAIYRLSHWGLKQINGNEVTEDDQQVADRMYAGLSDLVLWSLPESLLQPLLLRLRLDETCQASKMTAKQWLMQSDASLKSVVGKEALQWKKQTTLQDELAARQRGKICFNQMIENTCNAVEKLQRLDKMWDTMLFEMIRNALIDYSQIDAYVKNLLNELK